MTQHTTSSKTEEAAGKAYDADYSHLKFDYSCKKRVVSEDDIEDPVIDYDCSSDGQWVDNYDELRA